MPFEDKDSEDSLNPREDSELIEEFELPELLLNIIELLELCELELLLEFISIADVPKYQVQVSTYVKASTLPAYKNN
jgi:hypothetical protein